MEEERLQKELFPFESPKKRFTGFAGIFRKAGIDGSVFAITLKIDKLVFIFIAIIMIMVIVYALGVEKGKSVIIKSSPASTPSYAAPLKVSPEIKPIKPVSVVTVAAVNEVVKPYTIAVASLSRKDTAMEEVARMKANGFDSFVIYSQPYYVVCIGAFDDKTSSASQKELARVKRFCRDAYFKQK